MFLLWIETQPTHVVVLFVLTGCYLAAVAVLIVTSFLLRWPATAGVKATTPTMLSALGVVTGLVIAFLASHVWSNLTSAQADVVREASAIRDIELLAESLPDEMRTKVRAAVKTYIQFIETEDWPAMSAGRANLRRPPLGLTDALNAVLAISLSGSNQQVAQQRTVIAIQQALDARRSRVLMSEAAIEPTQWVVIIVLATLMLLTIGLVHADRIAAAANLFIFSSAIAALLVLLLVSDRPFSSGGVTVQPSALREVAPE